MRALVAATLKRDSMLDCTRLTSAVWTFAAIFAGAVPRDRAEPNALAAGFSSSSIMTETVPVAERSLESTVSSVERSVPSPMEPAPLTVSGTEAWLRCLADGLGLGFDAADAAGDPSVAATSAVTAPAPTVPTRLRRPCREPRVWLDTHPPCAAPNASRR